jgi:hypothetical protein
MDRIRSEVLEKHISGESNIHNETEKAHVGERIWIWVHDGT